MLKIMHNNLACGRTKNKTTFKKYVILKLSVFISRKGIWGYCFFLIHLNAKKQRGIRVRLSGAIYNIQVLETA